MIRFYSVQLIFILKYWVTVKIFCLYLSNFNWKYWQSLNVSSVFKLEVYSHWRLKSRSFKMIKLIIKKNFREYHEIFISITILFYIIYIYIDIYYIVYYIILYIIFGDVLLVVFSLLDRYFFSIHCDPKWNIN